MSMPGFWEFAFLGVLALLIFGPDKLPEVARTVGRTLRQFRREAQGALDELKRAAEVDELRKVSAELRSTAAEIEREAASAGTEAARPYGGTLAGGAQAAEDAGAAGALDPQGARPEAVAAGPAPFDPDAT